MRQQRMDRASVCRRVEGEFWRRMLKEQIAKNK
jgi:hypothetical protein